MAYNRRQVIIRDFFTCQSCGEPVRMDKIQIAHKIHQGEESESHISNWLNGKGLSWSKNRIRESIINNENNVCVTCCSRCNDKQNIFFKPVERDALLEKILSGIQTDNHV